MTFNSIHFLIFFPIVVTVYFVIPRNIRYIWLLISSYYFYMCWNPKYAILIAFSTIVTYVGGMWIEHFRKYDKGRLVRLCLSACIIVNLAILIVFKYANFLIANISSVFSRLGLGVIERRLDILLPVGISFYTFQALGYIIDVYKGRISAEKNVLKYALFVSFFPQLVAGPIERSENLLPQIQNVDKINVWDFDSIKQGFLLMCWGFFQKLVIADRASILVQNVFDNYDQCGSIEIAAAAFCFAFQIYGDFGGYTNIARGAAKIMGFSLMDNFRQPYLATSIKDFWRRWHISLTSWFTDYLYIPLGGNRKGLLRKYINILIVFGVSGLWHGAAWKFVAWGMIHAVYQIIEDIFGKKRKSQNNNASMVPFLFLKKIPAIICTFILVDFAWIFFASNSLRNAASIIARMITGFPGNTDGLGLDRINLLILLVSICLVMIVDVVHEMGYSITGFLDRRICIIRWGVYVSFVWSIIMLGIYGAAYDASAFIYFRF